ncbi:MAG: Tripartite tricarboxylate transporter TctA family protein [Methanomassiliicoccales archaeon PtaU1.Bin124]|nr:MAG: Tripartite tricarboxylate transporter TctA family protein [Methanomassiliicoccales archaeon PtaU1.Bin124]
MDPLFLLLVFYASICGSLLGAFTGVTPGLHVNTMALLVLITSSSSLAILGGILISFEVDPSLAPVILASLLVSAAVSHSFLDFLPSVFFGAPEESECLSMLPGHRLLLAGRGLEAVTVAAEGSLIGALLSIIVCAPLLVLGPMMQLDAHIEPYIPGLMLMAVALLILNERGKGAEFIFVVEKVSLPASLSVDPPIPSDGRKGLICGQVVKDCPLGRRVVIGMQSFVLKRHGGVGQGTFLLTGTWRSRRRRWVRPSWALLIFFLSGLVGLAVMDGRSRLTGTFDGMGTSLLLPLLTGLFALPSLLGSTDSGSIPKQDLNAKRSPGMDTSVQGSLAGLFAAWVPGVTATSGTVLAQQLSIPPDEDPDDSALRFIAMTAALGTAATVFGVLALCLTGSSGTGVLMAVTSIVPGTMDITALSSALLLAVLVASFMAYFLTGLCGRRLATSLSGRSSGPISRAILTFEVVLCLAMSGIPGMAVLIASTTLGLMPPQVGVSRVCLTGCLLLPLLLGCFGLDTSLYPFLGG